MEQIKQVIKTLQKFLQNTYGSQTTEAHRFTRRYQAAPKMMDERKRK